MRMTGYEHISDKKLFNEINQLYEESKGYMKDRKIALNIQSDIYIKSIFNDSFLLAERFIEFFDKNKWKFKSNEVDQYSISTLKQLADEAGELEVLYGKEKVGYFSTFENWQNTYALCRQYCINLTYLHNISKEYHTRHFIENKPMSKLKKPPNFIIKYLGILFNKLIAVLSILKT